MPGSLLQAPLASSLYIALYGPDREKRIELAHEPLDKRSAYEFAQLNIKRLRRDKKRMKQELKEVCALCPLACATVLCPCAVPVCCARALCPYDRATVRADVC